MKAERNMGKVIKHVCVLQTGGMLNFFKKKGEWSCLLCSSGHNRIFYQNAEHVISHHFKFQVLLVTMHTDCMINICLNSNTTGCIK